MVNGSGFAKHDNTKVNSFLTPHLKAKRNHEISQNVFVNWFRILKKCLLKLCLLSNQELKIRNSH